MIRTRLLLAVLLTSLASSSVLASVTWSDWDSSSFHEVVKSAAKERRLVMLVVTQPDWCPPCITLNEKWLENEKEQTVKALTENMVVLEIRGYDAEGAALLAREGVSFQGTPSVLVFAPRKSDSKLGQSPLLGGIVGAPKDFAERLGDIVAEKDVIKTLEREARKATTALQRARFHDELATLHLARGDAESAADALRALLRQRGKKLELATDKEQIGTLRRGAEWKLAAAVELRVRKDYGAAIQGIDAYIARHGRIHEELETIAFARAWALAKLGRLSEAREEMQRTFVSQRTADASSTYAYFCFRIATPAFLKDGEFRTREALQLHPDAEAELSGALARILRRQGKFREAAELFERAATLEKDEESRAIYAGQLDHVRQEMAAAVEG